MVSEDMRELSVISPISVGGQALEISEKNRDSQENCSLY